ncbi:unnamed protein product, partial [Ixodes hexagonus]
LDTSKVIRVFRYVDDYLIVLASDERNFTSMVADVLDNFKVCMSPLEITHELPDERSLRFLDLRLLIFPYHVCWSYEPRGNKPLLPFNSAHSKLVKRSIVRLCLKSSLIKSCSHSIPTSFDGQVSRLKRAGYPISLLTSVAEKLINESRQDVCTQLKQRNKTTKPIIVPYIHNVSHGLKKIANRVQVEVIFSAPNKLRRLCKKVNTPPITTVGCLKKHQNTFVPCTEKVVYSFPLSCGKLYIGQTGRCLNDRLREHKNIFTNKNSGHLGIHGRDCGCSVLLNNCAVLGRHHNQLTREIIEAENIEKHNDRCVSTPSLTLSQKELDYLALH